LTHAESRVKLTLDYFFVLKTDFHPFHIHLNPFQVISMEPSNVIGSLPGNFSLADAVAQTNLIPAGQWRDTVFIPPFGQTIVYQRFGEDNAFAGKTVYHCHFLDHEDQGMIAAFLIAIPQTSGSSLYWRGSALLVIAVPFVAHFGAFDLW
jgi:FtsP/CotA-like multicopper oxidase with cupredoxin domain